MASFTLPSLPPVGSAWGPSTSEASTQGLSFEDAPFAPFSKSDKLGKLADWSQEPGRDGRDQRGGRQGGRNHRGTHSGNHILPILPK